MCRCPHPLLLSLGGKLSIVKYFGGNGNEAMISFEEANRNSRILPHGEEFRHAVAPTFYYSALEENSILSIVLAENFRSKSKGKSELIGEGFSWKRIFLTCRLLPPSTP
jgi:hypothetical protein